MEELNLKNLDVEVDESAPTLPLPEVKPEDRVPLMHEADWSDYVLKQFEEDETIDGNPTVDGLRRVARKLLGDILESQCKVVSAPCLANEWASTVEHTVVFNWTREISSSMYGFVTKRFTEVADVNPFNCDAEFRRFASSTASTRAEARALRKALMLKRVVAAEEITEVAPEAEGDSAKGLITKNQMNFLKLIAKRIDINIPKYINMGKTKYDKLEDVPYATAVKMVGVLSEFQRKKEKIPDSIKGWKE